MCIAVGSRSKKVHQVVLYGVPRERPSMTVGLRLLASGEQSINKAKAIELPVLCFNVRKAPVSIRANVRPAHSR